MKTETLYLRIPSETAKAIRAAAKRNQVSASEQVGRTLILRYTPTLFDTLARRELEEMKAADAARNESNLITPKGKRK